LLNLWTRRSDSESKTITANELDVHAAFRLYSEIVESAELGIPPSAYDFYKRHVQPLLQVDSENMGVEFTEIRRGFILSEQRPLSSQSFWRDLVPTLEAGGLIYVEPDPNDRRKKRIHLGGTFIASQLSDSVDDEPVRLNGSIPPSPLNMRPFGVDKIGGSP